MKKVLFVGMLLGGTLGAFAQGQVNFNNDVIGTVITHVYSPDINTPGTETVGNSSVAYAGAGVRSGDFPTGTSTYTGVLIGGQSTGSGPTGYANGANYSAELLAAPTTAGTVQAANALTPVAASLTTMRTSSSASGTGGWVISTSPAIPGTTVGGSATMEMEVWYNAGNTLTYAQAVAGGFPAGTSGIFNVDQLGGTGTQGVVFVPSMSGLTSFSLTQTPEPSTIAMGVMGVCAFLIRRRK